MSEIQISINNLSKVYDNGFKALNNVSLKVKQGEISCNAWAKWCWKN